jgi:hypothetical protein
VGGVEGQPEPCENGVNMMMTREEIIKALKRKGWRKIKAGWCSPYHKRILQGIDLRAAASLEAFESDENLSEFKAIVKVEKNGEDSPDDTKEST